MSGDKLKKREVEKIKLLGKANEDPMRRWAPTAVGRSKKENKAKGLGFIDGEKVH